MKVKEIIEKSKPLWIANKNYDLINPTVTVVLPTFRRAKQGTFEKAVESVIAQTYTNWELIIVDDASTDGTEDLIKFYMDLDSRINTIRHTNNLGLPAISQYEAYKKARGEYIAFIFDDNVWTANHLFLAVKNMLKHHVRFTYGITCSHTTEGKSEVASDLKFLPITNCIGNGAVVIHREIYETVGMYDPHLTLTRLCDWDLWLRIYKKYYMYKINEIVTEEYGITLPDSLGNSVKMNAWIAYEQICTDRNEELLPENFEEYDILDTKKNSTDLFVEYLELFYSNYKNKCWFVDNFNKYKIIVSNNTEKKKRITVNLFGIDATYFLGFSNINDKFIIRPFLNTIPIFEIFQCDAIVYIRDIQKALDSMSLYKKYNIPIYFYIDDNFIEIVKDKTFLSNTDKLITEDYKNLAKTLQSSDMNEFNKVLVSTEKLKEDFEQKNIHKNITVLPPIMDIDKDIRFNLFDNELNLAFLGGKFRVKTFINKIFPALLKLSENIKINIICTEYMIEQIKEDYCDYSDENINLIEIKEDYCYNQFLLSIQNYNINFVIHSGEHHTNNKYKTKNSLINAVKLGAVLITSNIEPYNDCEEIITSENTTDDWYNTLNTLINDKEKCVRQFEIQKKFVMNNYSVKNGIDILTNIFEKIKSKKATEILSNLQAAMVIPDIQTSDINKNEIINYDYIDKICTFRAIKNHLNYIVKLPTASKRLGIFISADTIYSDGVITVEIKNGKNTIAASSRNIKDIKLRSINYFYFDTLLPQNKKLKLKLTASYSNAAPIGVYENRAKTNNAYKALRKIVNIGLPISNIMYYEI